MTRTVLLASSLFALNVALNLPLFLPGESPYRDSIEGGYAGMARFITNNPNPWGWNPLPYCGLPTQFLYVPALPYATAALSWISREDPVYVYKLLTATLACLGPVTLFLFLLYTTKSRGWALAGAIGYTFFSPLYGLIQQIDKDRGLAQLPWRLHVLTKYGEGPHNAGLTLLPLAWIAIWSAATTRRYSRLLLCAIVLAAIPLTNWVAGLALAFSCAMLLLAAAGTPGFRYSRAIVAAVLAYGFACFWLTPGFVRTIAFNWPADAYNYKLQTAQANLFLGFVLGLAAIRLLAWWTKLNAWNTFSALCLFGFGYCVIFFYSYGIDMVPESRRYALEFEMFLTLGFIGFVRLCWLHRNQARLVAAGLAVLALLIVGTPQISRYVTQGWQKWKPLRAESTTEYRVARWIEDQKPQGRVLASGGLRFRLNSWSDLPQVGGSFESGLKNRTPVHFAYHVRTGLEVSQAVEEMQALGVEYLVVHGPKSMEHYRDYKNPQKFEGVLERVDSEAADLVYRVPFRGIAHAMLPEHLPLHAFRGWLTPYIRAIETSPMLSTKWLDSSAFTVEGQVPTGTVVAIQVNYDQGWSATQDGTSVKLEPNRLGFITAHARPGSPARLYFRYQGTREQKLMAALSVVCWMAALLFGYRRYLSSKPTVA